jgi:hypothetical protein
VADTAPVTRPNLDEQAVHAAHVTYAEPEPGTGYVSNAECARYDSLAGAIASSRRPI